MVKRIALVFALVLLGVSRSFGQDVVEQTIIRSLLGVPQSTPVKSESSVAVPKDVPLKVYLEVSGDKSERDGRVKDGLTQWLDDRGKSNSASGIKLELVTDPSQARVALIHYSDFPTEIVDQAGNADGGGAIAPPSNSSTVKMSMIVYTYIIVMDTDNLKILYRRKDPIITRSTMAPGAYLTKATTDRLRNDLDKEVDKRALKSKGEKDSKRPDSRLRDELARWMASGDKTPKSQ